MKIQYKSVSLGMKSEKRYLCYRIEPSELSWWNRTFKNPWKHVYKSYCTAYEEPDEIDDCLRFLFYAKEAQEIVEKYDTYEKLNDFLMAEYEKAKSLYYEYHDENNSWKI